MRVELRGLPGQPDRQFVDRLEVRQRSAPGQVIFTLSVRMAQSLQK